MKRLAFWFIGLMGCGCCMLADAFKPLTVTAHLEPNPPRAHQPLFLVITADQSLGQVQFKWPSVPGLQMRYEGKSVQTLFVNGKRTHKESIHIRLEPDPSGTFVIPSFQGMCAKGSFTVPELTFSLDDAAAPSPYASGIQFGFTNTIPHQWYVGQCQPVSIQLAIRPNIHGELASYPTQSSEAFSAFKLPEKPKQTQLESQNVGFVWPALITAVQPGEASLQASVVMNVEVPSQSLDPFGDARDPFSLFQNLGLHQLEPIKITSDPVSVHILPLPSPKPKQFSQGIGQFQLQPIRIQETECVQNEPLSLLVELTGQGNFAAIRPPKLQYNVDQWRTYEPKSVFEAKDEHGYQGTLQFTYTIVPLQEGTLTLPSVEFCYFNPETHTYGTLNAAGPEVPIKAAIRTPQEPSVPVPQFASLKTTPPTWDHPNFLGTTQWVHPSRFWFIQALIAFVILGALGVYKHRYTPAYRKNKSYKQNLAQLEHTLCRAFKQQKSLEVYAAAHALIQLQLNHRGISFESALEGQHLSLADQQLQELRLLEQRYQQGQFGHHNVPMPDSLEAIQNLIRALHL